MTQKMPPEALKSVVKDPRQVRHLLEERARILARLPEKKDAGDAVLEVLSFHLGTENLGVPTEFIHEIQPLSAHPWSRIPCAPGFIVGIVNLRGRICSVMDLHAFWGHPVRPVSKDAHILLVKGYNPKIHGEISLALITDDLGGIRRVRPEDLMPPPLTTSVRVQAYVRGVTRDMMMVIHMEHLLSDPQIIVSDGDQ